MLITVFKLFDYLQISFWIFTYILIIFGGLKKKICLMPIFALTLNLGFETYRVVIINNSSDILIMIGLYSWLILDFIMLIIFFIYGDVFIKRRFITRFLLGSILFISFLVINLVLDKIFSNYTLYSAFSINIIMSVVCLLSFFKLNKDNYFFYLLISIFKCIGTFFVSVAYGVINYNLVILIIGSICFILDVLVIILVIYKLYKVKSEYTRKN